MLLQRLKVPLKYQVENHYLWTCPTSDRKKDSPLLMLPVPEQQSLVWDLPWHWTQVLALLYIYYSHIVQFIDFCNLSQAIRNYTVYTIIIWIPMCLIIKQKNPYSLCELEVIYSTEGMPLVTWILQGKVNGVGEVPDAGQESSLYSSYARLGYHQSPLRSVVFLCATLSCRLGHGGPRDPQQ